MLTGRTPQEEYKKGDIKMTNYINHDFNNLFRTSYDDMNNKV